MLVTPAGTVNTWLPGELNVAVPVTAAGIRQPYYQGRSPHGGVPRNRRQYLNRQLSGQPRWANRKGLSQRAADIAEVARRARHGLDVAGSDPLAEKRPAIRAPLDGGNVHAFQRSRPRRSFTGDRR